MAKLIVTRFVRLFSDLQHACKCLQILCVYVIIIANNEKSYAFTDAIIETFKVEMLNAFHYVIIIANNEKSYAFTDAIIETIKVEMLNAFHHVIIIANNEKSYAFTDAIIETIKEEMLNAFHYVILNMKYIII